MVSSSVVEVDKIVLFVIVNRSCQCSGWESVVFVTVNWTGQCSGWKSVVFVTVNRFGQCSGWESVVVTVNPGRCWGWEGTVFVKYCEPVSVRGGKVLCFLL